jgi:hypothetical protein
LFHDPVFCSSIVAFSAGTEHLPVWVHPFDKSQTPLRQAATNIIKNALVKDHPESLKTVQREMTLVRPFDHPCIFALHDVSESDHHIFVAESYVPSGSLSDCIQPLLKLTPFPFFRQIIDGIDYLRMGSRSGALSEHGPWMDRGGLPPHSAQHNRDAWVLPWHQFEGAESQSGQDIKGG